MITPECSINCITFFYQPTIRKKMIAAEVVDSFSSHKLVAVFHYNDVSCQEWKTIRNKLAKYEIKLKVVPAKLSSKVNILMTVVCSRSSTITHAVHG